MQPVVVFGVLLRPAVRQNADLVQPGTQARAAKAGAGPPHAGGSCTARQPAGRRPKAALPRPQHAGQNRRGDGDRYEALPWLKRAPARGCGAGQSAGTRTGIRGKPRHHQPSGQPESAADLQPASFGPWQRPATRESGRKPAVGSRQRAVSVQLGRKPAAFGSRQHTRAAARWIGSGTADRRFDFRPAAGERFARTTAWIGNDASDRRSRDQSFAIACTNASDRRSRD